MRHRVHFNKERKIRAPSTSNWYGIDTNPAPEAVKLFVPLTE